jgi:hypothetical protein
MSHLPVRRWCRSSARIATVLVLLGAALGACGEATPSPTNPAERFVAAISNPDLKLTAAVEGTFTLTANDELPLWGAFAVSGADSRMLVAIEEPLGIDAWEQFVHAGAVVARRGVGGWSEPVSAADHPPEERLRAALAAVEEVRDLGEERHGDRVLRHVRVDAFPITDAAFGIEVSGEAPEATLDAWVGEDGIPTELRVRTPTLTLTITPTAFGAAAPIPEPYELTTFRSNALRYTFVHPTTWEVEVRETGTGHQFGLDGAFILTYCVASSPRISLDYWTREGTAFYGNQWDSKPDEQRSVVIKAAEGPVKANLVSWHGTVEGRASFILDLAIVTQAVTCDIQWFSPPGHETEDRARFEQFIAGSRLGD